MGYAELHCLSNFSFLRGASHPEELVERAVALGYEALAITDECSVAGAVRAHVAAKARGFRIIIGSEFRLVDGLRCVLLATDRQGYGQLCRLITRARRAAPKGQYRLEREDFTGKGGSDQGVGGSEEKRAVSDQRLADSKRRAADVTDFPTNR
jgi:error-prone DNA polymerase